MKKTENQQFIKKKSYAKRDKNRNVILTTNLVVCTGDSTVPEFSSTYPINRWPNVKSTEVARADHNELLRDEEVIETILAYAIDDYTPPTRKKLRFKPDLTNGARIFDRVYKRPAI